MEQPLVNQRYQLKKFPGKGGWTYAELPEVLQDKHAPFGWVRVKGSIDEHHFKQYRLMPMGNGHLFLPVKAEIRKKINKKEGDFIHVTLFKDDSPLEIPEELLICLLEEPVAHDKFLSLAENEQKSFIDWIFSAKKVETRADRIAITIQALLDGLEFSEKGR